MAAAIAVASSPTNKNKSPTSRKLEFASKLLKQLAVEKQRSPKASATGNGNASSPSPSPSSSIATAKEADQSVEAGPAFPLTSESAADLPDISSLAIEERVEMITSTESSSSSSSEVVSEILELVEQQQKSAAADESAMIISDVEAILSSSEDVAGDQISSASSSLAAAAAIVETLIDNATIESVPSTSSAVKAREIPPPAAPATPASPISAAIAAAISLSNTGKLDSKLMLPRTPPRSTGRKPVPTSASKANPSTELKAHRVPAGCTAIVVLKHGMKLYVANAGDSRAVLCRGDGAAYALSDDHKPLQERELTRIMSAGGFVTKEGRINGNLNLSRSLGDLKYKQGEALGKENQVGSVLVLALLIS
jgi:hypothetical protein